MAPWPAYSIVTAMYDETKVDTRNLGSMNGTDTAPSLTAAQKNTLQYLALTFSTISVASAVLAFYWFVKMRRSFRHDLVMLLIQSDMFKALWFMIYPIVTFARGPVASNSTFCQVNGFFVAVGVEASDVAVLMIAIHSALYIFKPRASAGEGGLYPYRRTAYTIWFFLPIALASLAFTNSGNAYVGQTTYCYLPVRPFWYGLALSWIPRYLIFMFILVIYASIYGYVLFKFRGFDKQMVNSSTTSNTSAQNRNKLPIARKTHSLPPVPPIARHGLISDSRQSSAEGRLQSAGRTESYKQGTPLPRTATQRFMWGNFIHYTSSSQAPPSEPSTVDSDSFIGPSTPQPLSQRSVTCTISPPQACSIRSSEPSNSRVTSWRDDFVHRFSFNANREPATKPSMADIFSILRRGPRSTETPTPISQLQLVNSRGQNVAVAEMLRTREKIRRQLRFLFIYPLVYIGMWIIPFAFHIMQYDDRIALNPSFGLTCASTIFISSQAAADCWLFSTREKPWRHIPGSNPSFFASLKFWTGYGGVRERIKSHGPGKKREEMTREARAAYRRRDDELAQRRVEAENNEALQGDARRGSLSWWEGAGLGAATAMSPVAEEVSNPMDAILVSAVANFPSDSEATLREEDTEGGKSENKNDLEMNASPMAYISASAPRLQNIGSMDL